MTISTIDPVTALLVVDLQKGFVNLPAAHPVKDVVGNAVALLDNFRSRKLRVVLIIVDARAPGGSERAFSTAGMPADWTELMDELKRQPSDHTATKRSWGAFANTGLEQYLRKQGVTQVVVTGVSTSAGVESTARQAHDFAFNVTLPVDAMTDMRLEAHQNSVTRIFPRMSETGTTRELLDLLNAQPSA
jgi:nicotinamidase-related amidase